jgi:ankyrin repeat protein
MNNNTGVLDVMDNDEAIWDTVDEDDHIWEAMRTGDVQEVERLLDEEGLDVNFQCIPNGWTLLHYAVIFDQTSMIRMLLERGADMYIPCHEKWTPLQHAAFDGFETAAHLLISHDVDVNDGESDGIRPLSWAVFAGHLGMVHLLIDSGADVFSDIEEFGKNLLMYAATRGHADIVRLLISEGLDPEAELDGITALSCAKRHEHPHIIEILQLEIQHRANLLAFAMGGHLRLGADSPLSELPDEANSLILQYALQASTTE